MARTVFMFDQEDVVIRENMCIGESKLVVSCGFSQHKWWDNKCTMGISLDVKRTKLRQRSSQTCDLHLSNIHGYINGEIIYKWDDNGIFHQQERGFKHQAWCYNVDIYIYIFLFIKCTGNISVLLIPQNAV